MNMGNPVQVKRDYSHILGPDPMDRTKCEYWRSAPYSPTASDTRSDQRFVVQDGAQDTNMEEL